MIQQQMYKRDNRGIQERRNNRATTGAQRGKGGGWGGGELTGVTEQ